MKKHPGLRFLQLATLLLLVACQPGGSSTPGPSPAVDTPIPIADATHAPGLPTPLPPPVLPTPQETATSEATRDPALFLLPTPAETPESVWRPPLYQVPWALSPFDHFYFTRPFAANEITYPVADYRYGGIFFSSDIIHTGVDLYAMEGVPVLATGPGTVLSAGWGLYSGAPQNTADPYGLAVVIRHDFGFRDHPLFTVYAHLSEIDVVPGQWVGAGEVIGNVGRTGFTTGPHLHFEVRVDSNDFFSTRNPELWLAPPQGWGVLVGRVMSTYQQLLPDQLVTVRSLDTNQFWAVKTYGPSAVNSDPYYNENLVLGDLPEGVYLLNVPYAGRNNEVEIQVFPGQVTYFSFQGFQRYSFELPPTPDLDSILNPPP
ncbi:MAG: M23 family metallopeptidase [Chloroflexota bacterium]